MRTNPILLPVLAVVAIWPLACGPKVEAVETAQVVERDDDAEVLVFVRDVERGTPLTWDLV